MAHPPEPTSSTLETQMAQLLSAHLQETPEGAEFQVEPSSSLCSALEVHLPHVLSASYPQWKSETLDGLFVVVARKTGPETAELAGMCILMGDQTVTPFSLRFVLDPTHTSVKTLSIRLGEPGGGRLGISGPPCHSDRAWKLHYTLRERLPMIRWAYVLTTPGTGRQT